MKDVIYIVLVDGEPLNKCFKSLKMACNASGLKYNTVVRNFDISYSKGNKSIFRAELVKIKGRGSLLFSSK